MKTKFFKVFVLPVLVTGAALLSAFGSVEKADGALVPNEIGWRRIAPKVCQESTMCNEFVSTFCTVNNQPGPQLFRKDASGDCTIPLYHPLGR